MSEHWASRFIGVPWTSTANCWRLVRDVVRYRYGIDMPDVVVEADVPQVAPIMQAAGVSGWRPGKGPAQDGDIVLGWSGTKRHVGIMVQVGPKLLMLHSDEAIGFSIAQPLAEAKLRDVEFWRRRL